MEYKPLMENFNQNLDIQKENLQKVLVVGEQGAGKSSLCFSICDDTYGVFKDSSSRFSYSKKAVHKNVSWRGIQNYFTLIDTPGLNDGENKDIKIVNEII